MKYKKITRILLSMLGMMVVGFIAIDMASETFPVISDLISQYNLIPDSVVGTGVSTAAVFSVAKPGDNAGRVNGKVYTVIFFDFKDIETWPPVDEDGITVSGDIIFKAGATPIGCYATSSTINTTAEIEGEDDAKGDRQGVAFSHPGNEKEIRVFRNSLMNTNLGILIQYCDSEKKPDLHGTPCNPMQMGGSLKNDSSGTANMFEFKSQNAADPALIYEGVELVLDSGSGGGIQTA